MNHGPRKSSNDQKVKVHIDLTTEQIPFKYTKKKKGKIETRLFTKSEPIYLGPTGCHDPKVFKSIFLGVGLRLRINCSEEKDFDADVEILQIHGHIRI
jgi:hypothetical protein